jgi:hypothetical protein
MKFAKTWIALTAVTFSLLTASYLLVSNGDGVDIAAQKNDSELLPGNVTTLRHGIYKGLQDGESGPFVVQFSSLYENGKLRVTKTVLDNTTPYTTRTGNYVLYQYWRPDGSLEHDKLAEPEAHLGCSVLVKYRLRYFDKSNKQTEERYVRPDGSLGARIDTISHAITWFFADGVTVRENQTSDANGVHETRFRKNGTTVWWSTDYADQFLTHVHFDHQGNPINRVFISQAGISVFTMGSNDAPKLLRTDTYLRPNGTTDYVQTWYEVYDKKSDLYKEEIGSVSVYDASGKKPLRTYNLELREEGQPRLIKELITYNHQIVGAHSIDTVEHQQFSTANQFSEPVDDAIFQGFDDEIWGNPDDDSHGI